MVEDLNDFRGHQSKAEGVHRDYMKGGAGWLSTQCTGAWDAEVVLFSGLRPLVIGLTRLLYMCCIRRQ